MWDVSLSIHSSRITKITENTLLYYIWVYSRMTLYCVCVLSVLAALDPLLDFWRETSRKVI
jgi:hypothetical protein